MITEEQNIYEDIYYLLKRNWCNLVACNFLGEAGERSERQLNYTH